MKTFIITVILILSTSIQTYAETNYLPKKSYVCYSKEYVSLLRESLEVKNWKGVKLLIKTKNCIVLKHAISIDNIKNVGSDILRFSYGASTVYTDKKFLEYRKYF